MKWGSPCRSETFDMTLGCVARNARCRVRALRSLHFGERSLADLTDGGVARRQHRMASRSEEVADDRKQLFRLDWFARDA